MNKLPRTFCVTLKETPLRTKGFMEVAKATGLEVTPFYGVFGTRLGLLSKYPDEIEAPGQGIFLNESAIGCALSHFVLWRHLLQLPDEEFLILEDDALFSPDFVQKFEEVYARLPKDWQMAYVGWIRYGKDIPPVMVDEGISIRIPTATHAYLVKKSILEDLCACLFPLQTPIDLIIVHRFLPKIKYYVFDPPLVTQRSYLNITDPVWTSLVYDWQNDLYGCKKDIIKDLALREGWHSVERNDKNIWRWSHNIFTIKVPPNVDSLTLECTIPIENILEFGEGENKQTFRMKIGNNSLTVNTKGIELLSGKMMVAFVPAKYNTNSSDQRMLGISLMRVIINMGTTVIPVGVEELSAAISPPNTFKL